MTMPATSFNVPRGSFPTPIEPIGVGPLEGPLVQVQFNYKWCQVIVGSLSQLLLNTTWNVDDLNALAAIQEDVFDLMAAFCANPLPAGFTPNTGAEGDEDIMLRQNPDNPCQLQTSVDGINWCTWADLSKCQMQTGQQGAPAPQPAPNGGCQTYHVILPANQTYLLPTVVNPGDTLEISNLKGASNDGTLSPWYCGDGNLFFAGLCDGSSTTQPSDPVNTSPHLSLIAKAGGLAFPVLGGVISIGAVGAFQNLIFQVNDSILSDNSGTLEFDATICNEQSGSFTHVFNFQTDNGSWVPLHYTPCSPADEALWVAGAGWEAVFVDCGIATGTYHIIDLQRSFAARVITSIQVEFAISLGTVTGTGDEDHIVGNLLGVQQFDQSTLITAPPSSPWLWTGSDNIDKIDVRLLSGFVAGSSTDPGGSVVVSKITVSGQGTDPF
jgi:hypothetical protein